VTCLRNTRVLFLSLVFLVVFPLRASTPTAGVELSVAGAGPRQLEPTLQQSITRDYAKAWQTLSAALQVGDPQLLDQYWAGVAHDKFQRLVEDQKRGVQVRYFDKSHRLQAVFYPRDGAALVLFDKTQLELQVFSSGKLIHTESYTERYFVLMTPAQDRWLVRVLQSVPES
jgi:hypothetical protein